MSAIGQIRPGCWVRIGKSVWLVLGTMQTPAHTGSGTSIYCTTDWPDVIIHGPPMYDPGFPGIAMAPRPLIRKFELSELNLIAEPLPHVEALFELGYFPDFFRF